MVMTMKMVMMMMIIIMIRSKRVWLWKSIFRNRALEFGPSIQMAFLFHFMVFMVLKWIYGFFFFFSSGEKAESQRGSQKERAKEGVKERMR